MHAMQNGDLKILVFKVHSIIHRLFIHPFLHRIFHAFMNPSIIIFPSIHPVQEKPYLLQKRQKPRGGLSFLL